jgi:hypothetical protein
MASLERDGLIRGMASLERNGLIRGMASLEKENLVAFYLFILSEI